MVLNFIKRSFSTFIYPFNRYKSSCEYFEENIDENKLAVWNLPQTISVFIIGYFENREKILSKDKKRLLGKEPRVSWIYG